MNPILFGDEKAEGALFLPAECVGAYCIRPLVLPAKNGKAKGSLFPIRFGQGLGGTFLNPILFGGGKAEGSLFLPDECVGAYCIRPLILPAKDRKAQGPLFPIRVG